MQLGQRRSVCAALLFALSVASSVPAQATLFGRPGDTGQIDFVLENELGTGADALTVQFLSRVEPATFADRIRIDRVTVKEDPAAAQSITIPAAQSRTFVIDYTITAAAQDGESFDLVLTADFGEQVSLPDPASWATRVSFAIASPDSSTRTA